MKRLAKLSVVMLSAIFLVVGCGGGGSQVEQDHAHQDHAHQDSDSAKLDLRPQGGSGVSGAVTFEDISEGVIVKVDLRDLPEPETSYLAHLHPGTCAQGEREEEGAHEHGEHEEGSGEQIDYPLSQVRSDPEGRGSSTTTLRETSVEKLFSGKPKHVNVHAVGSGNPPPLTCADLQEAG